MTVSLADKDVGADDDDDPMGRVDVDLRGLADRRTRRQWYRLRPPEPKMPAGKVELALRWVHDPKLVEPLPWELLDPKDVELPFNALRVYPMRCRSASTAPPTLEAVVSLVRPRAPDSSVDAHERATAPETRPAGTRFTSWKDHFLLPLDDAEPEADDGLRCVVRCPETRRAVGAVEIPWDELKKVARREWWVFDDAPDELESSGEPRAEVELAYVLVHDAAIEREREFRELLAARRKAEYDQRGYHPEDLENPVVSPADPALDRFRVIFRFTEGKKYVYGDTYTRADRVVFVSRAGRAAAAPRRVLFRATRVRRFRLRRRPQPRRRGRPAETIRGRRRPRPRRSVAAAPSPPSATPPSRRPMLTRCILRDNPKKEWYVYDVPTATEFRDYMPQNMYWFCRKCFKSGYRVDGAGDDPDADEAYVMAHVEAKSDFTLYLDAPRTLFDDWADWLFDVYTKTYEGPFEIDGVWYGLPDSDSESDREVCGGPLDGYL